MKYFLYGLAYMILMLSYGLTLIYDFSIENILIIAIVLYVTNLIYVFTHSKVTPIHDNLTGNIIGYDIDNSSVKKTAIFISLFRLFWLTVSSLVMKIVITYV